MALHSAILATPGRRDLILSSGQYVSNFHAEGDCYGNVCAVHKPSAHGMRDWPLVFTGAHMARIVPGLRVPEPMGFHVRDYSDDPVMLVVDPDDYGFLATGVAILRNSAICRNCQEHIFSVHRHDFSECSCGDGFVDGGYSYLRRSPGLIDTSVVYRADIAVKIEQKLKDEAEPELIPVSRSTDSSAAVIDDSPAERIF